MIKIKNKIFSFCDEKQRRINTLELENENLKSVIKDELYKIFMEKLGEPVEIARLKKENKKLRQERKTLKAIVMEGHKKHGKKN